MAEFPCTHVCLYTCISRERETKKGKDRTAVNVVNICTVCLKEKDIKGAAAGLS